MVQLLCGLLLQLFGCVGSVKLANRRVLDLLEEIAIIDQGVDCDS